MRLNTFTSIGIATRPDGETKVRFDNNYVARFKSLHKLGWTNIEFWELPRPMSKLEALKWLDEKQLDGDAGYVVSYKLAEKLKEAKKAALKTGVRSIDDLKKIAESKTREPVGQ